MASSDLRTIAHAVVLVAAILAVIAVALWLRAGPLEPQALAKPVRLSTGNTGVPDSGRQRMMILKELQKLNGRLEAVESALRDGTYVIQTKPADGDDKPGA